MMTTPAFSRRVRGARAFTLVELLVATVVLLIILLMLVAMVNQTSTIWRTSSAKVEQFRSARTAFDSINRHLSQATLNTYFDYLRKDGKAIKYVRQSDLRFIVGATTDLLPDEQKKDTDRKPLSGPGHAVFFHAPLGFTDDDLQTKNPAANNNPMYADMDNLLNTWGYFIEYGSDYNYRPSFLNDANGSYVPPQERNRYRLMEFMVPSDRLTIYRKTSSADNSLYRGHDWFFDDFLSRPAIAPSASTDMTYQPRSTHLLAENILTLVIWPQLSPKDQAFVSSKGGGTLAPSYTYDSSYDPTNPSNSPSGAPGNTNSRVDPHAQLPPVVQVTMVAMDEASAARVEADKSGAKHSALDTEARSFFRAVPPELPQTGNYANNYNKDLKDLQAELVKEGITYRTFTTTISLRAAKWSQD